VWFVLGLHNKVSHSLGSRLDGRTSKEVDSSLDLQWMLPIGGGVFTSTLEGLG
jgi:hypothetical protein